MSGDAAAVTSEEIREEAICRISMALHLLEGNSEWDDITARHWRIAEHIASSLGDMIPTGVAYRTLEDGSGGMMVTAQGDTVLASKPATRQRQFVGSWSSL